MRQRRCLHPRHEQRNRAEGRGSLRAGFQATRSIRRKTRQHILLSLALALGMTAAGCRSNDEASPHPVFVPDPAVAARDLLQAQTSPDFYSHQVQPILEENCYRCHAGLNHRGGLRVDSEAQLQRGGKHGPVLVPGRPEQSLLIRMIRHDGKPGERMPPRKKMSDEEIAAVIAWVQAGAKIP